MGFSGNIMVFGWKRQGVSSKTWKRLKLRVAGCARLRFSVSEENATRNPQLFPKLHGRVRVRICVPYI